jgi:Leucine-rich repeat (LRR) protein
MNRIGEAGAAHLAGLTQLQRLDLDSNNIGEAGVAHLVGLSQLKKLDLRNNQIEPASIDVLKQTLVGCQIHSSR